MQYIGEVQCAGRREMDLCRAVLLIENKPAAAGTVAACRAHAREGAAGAAGTQPAGGGNQWFGPFPPLVSGPALPGAVLCSEPPSLSESNPQYVP